MSTAAAGSTDPRAAPAPPVPGPLRRWVLGARPRTLWAAVVPVVVGTACGWFLRTPHWVAYAPFSGASVYPRSMLFETSLVGGPAHVLWARAFGALVVAVAIQIGTNYANDYADGVRGTDERRVGPLRLVGSGLASPGSVKRAALACFGVAALAGVALAAVTSWWLVPIGAACFLAGWFYTGGPKPYGYLGLGELFVFVFFGLVATVGSAYVQVGDAWIHALFDLPQTPGDVYFLLLPVWAAIAVGLLATALLEANNLRDIAGDTVAGKRTLAVRLGRRRAGWLYVGSIAGVTVGVILTAIVRPWALLALLALPLAVAPTRAVLGPAEGRQLLPVLGATARLQIVMGALLTLGILL